MYGSASPPSTDRSISGKSRHINPWSTRMAMFGACFFALWMAEGGIVLTLKRAEMGLWSLLENSSWLLKNCRLRFFCIPGSDLYSIRSVYDGILFSLYETPCSRFTLKVGLKSGTGVSKPQKMTLLRMNCCSSSILYSVSKSPLFMRSRTYSRKAALAAFLAAAPVAASSLGSSIFPSSSGSSSSASVEIPSSGILETLWFANFSMYSRAFSLICEETR
mmetsp:Transcript_14644/g.55364  ORF Transcript_14644/g.55364 Transcript_14644/m.55364 type:complete len:219 (+) Transcript_14644:850-1506(+)